MDNQSTTDYSKEIMEMGGIPVEETQPTTDYSQIIEQYGGIALSPEQTEQLKTEERLASVPSSELWKGRVEAGLRGLVSRPVVALGQQALGITPEESKLREEALGSEATAIEFGAMALPAVLTLGESALLKAGLSGLASGVAKVATLGEFTQAGLLTKAGQAAVKGLGIKGAVAAPALAMGVEGALFSAADETAKAIEGNPNTVSQAAWNVGLSGLTGVGFGAAIGKTSQLWKEKYGPSYRSFMNDFTSRWKDVTKNELPAASVVAEELQKVVSLANDVTGEVFGVSGLKRQELKELLPDIAKQETKEAFNKAVYDTDQFFKTLQKDPDKYYLPKSSIRQLKAASNELIETMVNPSATGADMFAAIDDYKKIVGKHAKFDVEKMPVAQEEGAALAKKLFGSLMSNLEDEAAWGIAAKRQNEINKAASKFFQARKPFETLATSKGPDGKRYVDPAKLETLINQAKKGSARGVNKQERLEYYLDVVDDLYNAIDKIDSKLGIKAVTQRPSMTASRAVTQKLTPGMKAADFLYGRAIESAAEAGGLGLGYKLGKGFGVPFAEYLGAAFGHYQIKPLLKTVLPAIVKPMLAVETVAANGIRAAGQVVGEVARGEIISKMAADALFVKDKPVKGNNKADLKHLERLDNHLLQIERNPDALMQLNDEFSEFMPSHGMALNTTAMTAINYLSSKRPFPKQNKPMDTVIEPSKAQIADYYRTLEIAENPLVICKKIKDGTLKSKDLVDFRSMYPTLYEDLTKKIMSSYANHLQKGGKVDYKTKKGLSLFALNPLDSCLTPQAIQSAQAVFMKNNMPQQQQQLPQMAPKSSRKSQLPSMTETDSQRRQMNR